MMLSFSGIVRVRWLTEFFDRIYKIFQDDKINHVNPANILLILSKALDGINDVNLLLFRKLRITRQSERLIRCGLRLRKITFFISQILETLLQVKPNRIVDFAAYIVRLQVLHQRIAISGNTNHVLVKNVTAIGSNLRRDERKPQVRVIQKLRVNLSLLRALIRPFIQTRKLHIQYGRLQLIEPAVDSDFLVLVFVRSAVRAQSPQTRVNVVVIGGKNPTITRATEVLGRIKTETSDHAHRARAASFVSRANRLSRILDHRNPMTPPELKQRIHRRTLAVNMHRHDDFGSRRDRIGNA